MRTGGRAGQTKTSKLNIKKVAWNFGKLLKSTAVFIKVHADLLLRTSFVQTCAITRFTILNIISYKTIP